MSFNANHPYKTMSEERDEIDLVAQLVAKRRKNVGFANFVIVVLFLLGNIVIPSFFWHADFPSTSFTLATFLSGIWATQATMIGIYAAFTQQFIIVRLAWFAIGLTACVLSMLLGLQMASHRFSKQALEADLLTLIVGMAFSCSSIVLSLGLGLRVFLKYRLVSETEAVETQSSNFGIAFLFRLTTAIAILMLLWKLIPIQFGTGGTVPMFAFVQIIAMTFILVSALIASVLQAGLGVVGRRKGFSAMLLLLFLGTPVVVIVSRMILPNSWYFWFQLIHYLSFLSGFVVSLLIVFGLWRRAGLRLVW